MPISFRRAFALTTLVLVVPAACRDAITPVPTLDISVSVSEQKGPFSVQAEVPPRFECDVTFEARAAGHHAYAQWLDASVVIYAGQDRQVPLDSVMVAASDLRSTFSTDTIGAGQVEHTRWLFSVGAAFDITMNFHYQVVPGGEIKTAPAQFTCGPQMSPGASWLQSIAPLIVTPSHDGRGTALE